MENGLSESKNSSLGNSEEILQSSGPVVMKAGTRLTADNMVEEGRARTDWGTASSSTWVGHRGTEDEECGMTVFSMSTVSLLCTVALLCALLHFVHCCTLHKLNLRYLVTYRWRNQEGKGVGLSELSRRSGVKMSLGNQFWLTVFKATDWVSLRAESCGPVLQ